MDVFVFSVCTWRICKLCMCVCVPCTDQRPMLGVFITPSSYFSRKSPSLNMDGSHPSMIHLGWLASEPHGSLSPPPQCWGYRHIYCSPWLLMGVMGILPLNHTPSTSVEDSRQVIVGKMLTVWFCTNRVPAGILKCLECIRWGLRMYRIYPYTSGGWRG